MINRLYNFSDSEFLQYASNIVLYLNEDLLAFSSFDPSLNMEKKGAIQQLVDVLLAEGGDEMSQARLAAHTDEVHKAMDACRQHVRDLHYWVGKAFPDSSALKQQFGIGRMKQFGYTADGMTRQLTHLQGLITTHHNELVEVGAPSAVLEAITIQLGALEKALEEREQCKNQRIVMTEARIRQLNELYLHLRDFRWAAPLVFRDSAAKNKHYRLPVQPRKQRTPNFPDDEDEWDGVV